MELGSEPNRNSGEDSPNNTQHSVELNKEEIRLTTFLHWPRQSPVSVERLARAGFYYSSNGTEVTCFSCGGKISEWNYGDSVIEKHKWFYPNCNFVRDGANNIPFHPSSSSEQLNQTSSQIHTKMRNVNGPTVTMVQNDGGSFPYGISASFNPDCLVQDMNPIITANGSAQQCSDTKTHSSINMKLESERLKTFKNKWPLGYIDVKDLVKAGLYYIQVNDKVQCAFCDGILTNWAPGDFPMAEHVRNFPLCPFVMGRDVGNIPLSLWDIPATTRSDGGVCEYTCNFEDIYTNKRKVLKESKQDKVLKNLGIERHEAPQHPSQASKDTRLRSFQSWPLSDIIKPEQLAEAGFFYIGISDHTKCFYCDGDLYKWEPGDNPWIEHAKWFYNCTFVRLNKGEAFIKACIEGTIDSNVSKQSGAGNTEYHASGVPPAISATHNKVDDVMKSNMVQAFIETDVFPVYLIRQAILRLVQESGEIPRNFNDLSVAIDAIKNSQQTNMQQGSFNPIPSSSKIIDNKHAENEEDKEQNIKSIINIKETKNLTEALSSISFSPKTDNPGGSCSILKEEITLLKEQRMCKICMDQEVGVVFLPCGHLMACPQCAPALKDCPLCRMSIKGTIKTFLA